MQLNNCCALGEGVWNFIVNTKGGDGTGQIELWKSQSYKAACAAPVGECEDGAAGSSALSVLEEIKTSANTEPRAPRVRGTNSTNERCRAVHPCWHGKG